MLGVCTYMCFHVCACILVWEYLCVFNWRLNMARCNEMSSTYLHWATLFKIYTALLGTFSLIISLLHGPGSSKVSGIIFL